MNENTRHPEGRRVVIGLLFALVALAIVGPGFSSRLGEVDDHEIPVIQAELGSIGPIATFEGTDHLNGRFRPLYWVGRITETAAWGENLTGWYLDRFALLLLSLVAGYLLARLWLPPIPSLLAAVLLVAGPQAEAFYRLGPQEAYAVPLTLAGLALVGRRRFWGLGLLVLAAFTKEPFVLVPLVGMAWAWWLGARRSVVAAGAGALVAIAGVATAYLVNGGDYYSAQGLTPVFQGRYLYPFIIAVAIAAGFLARRPKWSLPLGAVAILGILSASSSATTWAAGTRGFAALVDELRAEPGPIVVTITDPWAAEYGGALRDYLPGRVTIGPPEAGARNLVP